MDAIQMQVLDGPIMKHEIDTLARARAIVARKATGPEDAAELLDALGIADTED